MAPTQRQVSTTSKTLQEASISGAGSKAGKPIMPLPLVALSGLSSVGLLIWCVLWVAFIILIDAQRVSTAISLNLSLFLTISFSYFFVLIYCHIKISSLDYVLDHRDGPIIVLTRLIGVSIVLIVFKYWFLDNLLVTNIQELAGIVITDINDGI